MGVLGSILVSTFFIPVFMVSMYFIGIRCSLKTWSLIGLPCVAIGISGVLFLKADSYRLTPEQAGTYTTTGWVIFACALPALIYVFIKCRNKYRQTEAKLKNGRL